MLTIPRVGFNKSVTTINVNRSYLGDWLESSVIFGDRDCSRSDVVDILTEENVAEDQNLAFDIASEGWVEIENRLQATGASSTFALRPDRLVSLRTWTSDPVRSFLLLISLFEVYPDWAKEVRDVNAQGTLFERVAYSSFNRLLLGWSIYRAGWSPTGASDIPSVVRELSGLMGMAGYADPIKWAGQSAKDAGLDLMCYRPFADGREGIPYYAVQCASGANWTKKLNEPSVALWQKLLDAAFRPTRILAIPFVVDREELPRRCMTIEGPLIDRLRLLSAGDGTSSWIDPTLASDLVSWMTPRVAALPFVEY